MIEIKIKETGIKNEKGFENECRVLIKGSGRIVEPQLVTLFDILEKELESTFTDALESWLKKSILDEFDNLERGENDD